MGFFDFLKKSAEPAAPAAPTTKKCPFCQSEIPLAATRCPHCTSMLVDQAMPN